LSTRTALLLFFGTIMVAMLGVTSWASSVQAIWDWTGHLQPPNHAWTIATLFDAYFGFLVFYAWLAWKERGLAARLGWLVGVLLLGNMAMAAYGIREALRLGPADTFATFLTRRSAA
jgi:hypothetical protein